MQILSESIFLDASLLLLCMSTNLLSTIAFVTKLENWILKESRLTD